MIDGTQLIYCKLFRSVDLPMRHATANSQVISMTPRYAVESLSMVLVAAIALSFSLSEGGLIAALPVLGAIALGAQRMIPALQLIYGNWASMRASKIIFQDTLDLLDQPLSNLTSTISQFMTLLMHLNNSAIQNGMVKRLSKNQWKKDLRVSQEILSINH